jgi:hypothetical protein
MKNYIATIIYKTELRGESKYFSCVVKGKKNYQRKAMNLLQDTFRLSAILEDFWCEGVTEKKENSILLS